MDNLTHTLIGGLAGAAIARRKRCAAGSAVAASILANNFPDIDIFYAGLLSRPFGFLLHHRGHTHTLAGAALCGAAAWLVLLLLYRLRGQTLSGPERGAALIAAITGGFLHLAVDWMNTYGIHPYWPLNNGWVYGDTLFIIEPLLWITLTLAALPLLHSGFRKWIVFLPVPASVLLMVFSGRVPLQEALFFFSVFLAVAWGVHRLPALSKSRAWLAASLAIVIIFAGCGAAARQRLLAAVPDEGVLIASFVGPMPASPLCWTYFQQIAGRDQVLYRRGAIQLLEPLIKLDCAGHSVFGAETGAAAVKAIAKSELLGLADNCRWQAFLQFSRTPGVVGCQGGGRCSYDLRFDRDGVRRSVFNLPLEGECPGELPPWKPPTGDLNKLLNASG